MKIHGFNTLTLLDYPGHTGASVFLGGCNFRCPFCQNAGLVLHPEEEPFLSEEEVLAFLKKRQGVLEGVCISGGEPTLHQTLPLFIKKIKQLGYLVKLDTNGTNPAMIQTLYEGKLIDYVAMDIKTSPEHYGLVAGVNHLDLSHIKTSVSYLMNCGIEYEFRTTVVKELHTSSDFLSIAEWISGAKAYYLQAYQDSEQVIRPGFHSYTKEELELFCLLLQKKIPLVKLRGI